MYMEEEIVQEQGNISGREKSLLNLLPHQYKKGQSGNPSGRPKGQSLKEYIRNKFIYMTDDEKEEFFNGLPKEVIWKMGEGNPENKTDITSNGERVGTLTPEQQAVIDQAEEKLFETNTRPILNTDLDKAE